MTLVEIGMIMIGVGLANMVAIWAIVSVCPIESEGKCAYRRKSFVRGSAGQSS